MGNVSTLMDKMKPQNSNPASRQPQQRPQSKHAWRFNLNTIAQKVLGISKIFFDGKQPLPRPSKRPINQCWISFSKKVFKGRSKRPEIQVSICHLPIRFFLKIFAFLESSGMSFLLKFHFQSFLVTFIFWPLCYGGLRSFQTVRLYSLC